LRRSKKQLAFGFETLPCFIISRAYPVPANVRPIGVVGIQPQFTDRFAARYKTLLLVRQQVSSFFFERGAVDRYIGERETSRAESSVEELALGYCDGVPGRP